MAEKIFTEYTSLSTRMQDDDGGKSLVGKSKPDIVEVPVRHGLLRGQLAQLVQQHVQLELGRQVRQPPVAERLPVTTSI